MITLHHTSYVRVFASSIIGPKKTVGHEIWLVRGFTCLRSGWYLAFRSKLAQISPGWHQGSTENDGGSYSIPFATVIPMVLSISDAENDRIESELKSVNSITAVY